MRDQRLHLTPLLLSLLSPSEIQFSWFCIMIVFMPKWHITLCWIINSKCASAHRTLGQFAAGLMSWIQACQDSILLWRLCESMLHWLVQFRGADHISRCMASCSSYKGGLCPSQSHLHVLDTFALLPLHWLLSSVSRNSWVRLGHLVHPSDLPISNSTVQVLCTDIFTHKVIFRGSA